MHLWVDRYPETSHGPFIASKDVRVYLISQGQSDEHVISVDHTENGFRSQRRVASIGRTNSEINKKLHH